MSTHNMFFSFLVGIMLLGGCSTDYFNETEGNMPSKSDIMAIRRGMPQSAVRELIGSPSIVSSLDHRTWIYMNSTIKRLAFFAPDELERNVLAIQFDHDGKVEKVVQLTKENGEEVIISKDETPVMGKDESFMEKYFGGVGYMPMQPTKASDGL